jgi:Protein of unknown function (DUF938)
VADFGCRSRFAGHPQLARRCTIAEPAPGLLLDVNGPWPVLARGERYDAGFTANTLHIISWPEVQRLFTGLRDVLTADALLAVYGPFNYNGAFTSDSNRAFDESLKRQSPTSGIRDFEAVDAMAASIGFELIADHAMPANNRLLVWRRNSPTRSI